ncbi:MAG: hypothetical protein ACFFCZ_11420 [Promethearchaeota archaeon]
MKAFMVLVIACLLIGGVGAAYGLQDGQFTIADFWLEGGKITYEYYSNLALSGIVLDFELSTEGSYSFQGNTTAGKLKFLNNETYDPIYLILAADELSLDPNYYTSMYGDMKEDDIIRYDFKVTNGRVDFVIWTEEEYNKFTDQNNTDPLYPIRVLENKISASGTVQIPSNDTYYFTWVNWGTGTVTVNFALSYQLQPDPYSAEIEIDPIQLKDHENRPVNLFGMDTTGWAKDGTVLIEIAEQDVYFSIIREEDLTIIYNGNSTAIPCWVLEKPDYEEVDSETGDLYTGNYTLWKSKYSGVTLKSTYDGKVYDSEDTLIGTVYREYSVTSASNVILLQAIASSFSITDVLVFVITTFTILVLLKKYKFKRREP